MKNIVILNKRKYNFRMTRKAFAAGQNIVYKTKALVYLSIFMSHAFYMRDQLKFWPRLAFIMV